jgi:hypothetical protein
LTGFNRIEYGNAMTVSNLIDALGGTLAVSKICGVGPSAVSNWRKFGVLPPRLYLTLAKAGAARGIRVDPELFVARESQAA